VRHLLLALISVIILAPSVSASSKPSKSLTIDSVVSITSHQEFFNLSVTKQDELTAILKQINDPASARKLRPAAERLYIECQLLNIRLTMLPRPQMADMIVMRPSAEAFKKSRELLMVEMERVNGEPALLAELRSIVEPHTGTARGRKVARTNTAISTLQTIRSQAELYMLQHQDEYPDFRKHGWKQLTGRTTITGEPNRRGEFGPYLQVEPRNPLNNFSAVHVVKEIPDPNFKIENNTYGWVWDERDRRIHALDANGALIDEDAQAGAR
jgi:hypothetical protein